MRIYPFSEQQVLSARRCGLLASRQKNALDNDMFLRPAQLMHLFKQDLAKQPYPLNQKTLPFTPPQTSTLFYNDHKAEAYILYAGKKLPKQAPDTWLLKIFFTLEANLTPVIVSFQSQAPYLSYQPLEDTWRLYAQNKVPMWLKITSEQLLTPQAVLDKNLCLKPNLCSEYAYCYPDNALLARLPQRHFQNLQQWHDQGINPEKLSPKQRLVWIAETEQRIFWPEQFLKKLKELAKPWATLDFEVIHSAIPLWAECEDAFAAIPFAWSCHYLSNHQLIRKDFIADGQQCPEKLFMETLFTATEKISSIFVYGSLEKRLLRQLATRHPDAAPALLQLQDKMLDVYQAIQNEFYHPWMQGSWSLKRWTDFFLQEKSKIDHGAAAELLYWQSLAFAKTEKDLCQQALVDYCAQDSWILWKLIAWLEQRGH